MGIASAGHAAMNDEQGTDMKITRVGGYAMLLWGISMVVQPDIYAVESMEHRSLITLAFEDAPVQKVLQALADHQRLNLVMSPGVHGNMSLRLEAVSWQQALNVVMRLGALQVEREGHILLVSSNAEWQQRQQQQREAVEQQTAQDVLENLFVSLQHADASGVAESLQAQRSVLLSSRGNVSVDKRTNTLLIRDTSAALQQLKPWLEELDRPLAQVQLAAHIITIGSENLRALGVNWGLSGQSEGGNALSINGFDIGLPIDSPAANVGFHLARLNGRLLDLELTALEQENQVEIIASPRLFTAHQQTASIKQGTEIPYQVSSGASGATAIEFKEAVLGMEVTPTVLRDGKITLNLKISQNMPGQIVKQNGSGEALAIDKQEIQTQITVSNGETIVLGGIFQQQKTQGERKVPVLSAIPLIGKLFQNQRDEHKRRELVIFITPTLVDGEPDHPFG